jgi:hypothetical protein
MLLTATENGAGGKSGIYPDVFFADKSPEYLHKHCIPSNPILWQEPNFQLFIEERKILILAKLNALNLINLLD